jgi:hypothetical protein
MNSLLRLAYRSIIRMHPPSFRSEFGSEMLWIFDEESRNGSTVNLFLDGICSVVLQHAKPRTEEAATPGYREVTSAPPVSRFAQAGLILLSSIFFTNLFLSSSTPKLTSPKYSTSETHHAGEETWLLTRLKALPLPHNKAAKI